MPVAGAQTAAPAPAIQYDEISRTVMLGATPAPAADAFTADASQVKDGKITSKMPQAPSMPQMGGGLGSSLLGSIFNPMGALMNIGMQMVMGSIMSSVMSGAMHGGNIESGRETHVAFYGTMARFENYAEKTVTIVDMKTSKRTELDLAKRQYRVSAVDSQMQAMPQMGSAGGAEGSGTANVTLTVVRTQGGTATIAGVEAAEYDTTATIAIANATGSCHDMTMQFQTVEYYANATPAPGGSRPTLTKALIDHPEMLAGQGCTAKAQVSQSGPALPENRLMLYSRTQISSPEMEAAAKQSGHAPQQMWMVMERGNIRPVTAAEAAGLFTVPEGFAEQQ